MLKPFATRNVQHRSKSFNKIERMLEQMLKPFASGFKAIDCRPTYSGTW